VDKKKRTRELIVFAVTVLALLAGCLLTPSGDESEPIQEVMRDAVLHEQNKVSLFGLIEVNPGLISAYIVTGILIVFALVCRLFVIPKFKYVPGRFQLVLEQIVGMFDGLAEGSSPHRNKFLRAYIFTAGVYIFVSTLFELLGIQVVTTSGHAVSLPAPLSDINGAIALGVMSYGVILFGGLIAAGVGGFLHALKDFSLPISMSFRLFGALLSGALVTELVYYYAALSYVLPVIVGVMFTLLHALIQAYVLTMLVSTFYGESTEKHEKKPKAKKVKNPAAKRLPEERGKIAMKTMKKFAALMMLLCALMICTIPALAANESGSDSDVTETVNVTAGSNDNDVTSAKAMGSGVMIGIACLGGALAMGIAVGKSSEAMARQPEATSQIRTTMMMGLVFIETVIIYALIVAILIIFVL